MSIKLVSLVISVHWVCQCLSAHGCRCQCPLEVRRHWHWSHECALRVRTGDEIASCRCSHRYCTSLSRISPIWKLFSSEGDKILSFIFTAYVYALEVCFKKIPRITPLVLLVLLQQVMGSINIKFCNMLVLICIKRDGTAVSLILCDITRKGCPSWDSNHTPSAIVADVLSQLD